ncbi:MAG: MFS transporter [Chloroflexota bacterium]
MHHRGGKGGAATEGPEAGETGIGRILGVNRNVFFLSLTSFFQDISGEMIFTIMPLFLATTLGVKTSIIGLITGISDSTASLLKLAGGWLSDRTGQRKSLTALGYALSTIAKPFLYFAAAWGPVLAVRFTDRVGKGIRTSPRDALVADSTPPNETGRSFGFHRALDSLGAVVGLAGAALIVFLLQRGDLDLSRATYQTLVLVGVVPGIIAVLLVLLFVREVKQRAPAGPECLPAGQSPVSRGGLDGRFKVFLGIMVLFSLGNSGDVFLILRAQNLGLSVFHVLLLLVLFNMVYSLLSMPAGILSDRLGRKGLIASGWACYVVLYLGLALASARWHVLLLFVLYGAYYGLTEGVARAFVCDLAPSQRLGTAYGWYHGLVGITLLPASLIAGLLWQMLGPQATFLFGAGTSALALLGLLALFRSHATPLSPSQGERGRG